MPVYNAERFLNDSMNSILNQTLDDLELICVDDGSTDKSLEILNGFKDKDSRVKVYSLKHEGGGNARNYGLNKVSGEYLYLMDADDVLDLNAFSEFYSIAKEKNLDFLVFKAINYGVEKDHYFETDYQNMQNIYQLVKDKIFSFEDLGDTLFDFNVSPWCKFYNLEFVKSTGAKFRENSKFHDNNFFWDIIFKAKRILFLNEFYYTRKRYDQSLTGSGDISHMDMIDVTNDIIKIFIKHAKLERYKHILYNLKVSWITDRYRQVKDNKIKEKFLKKMKNDYENQNMEFPQILNTTEKFIYDSAILSDNYNTFDKLIKYYSITNENKAFNDKIPKFKKWIETIDENYQPMALNVLKKLFKNIDTAKLQPQNHDFYDNIINSENIFEYRASSRISDLEGKLNQITNEKLQKEITSMLDDYKTDLITLEKQKDEINKLKDKNRKQVEQLQSNDVEIAKLKSKADYLVKKHNYQKIQSTNKNKIKKLISRK